MNDFAQILEEAGGAAAAPGQTARLRAALADELRGGAGELARPRSGYGRAVTVGFADEHAVLPVPVALRADAGAASERAWLLTAAAIGALVAADGGPVTAAAWEGRLVLLAAGADGDLAALAFEEQVDGIDRLRARALRLPDALVAHEDPREPINSAFAAAERAARLGARPADPAAVEALDDAAPGDGAARPHEDPEPAMRAARRILQRLRGMGKWGGYHTEFTHLAKGFPGHERALALEVGEALLAAGLLAEKRSVGQRHVYLEPGRAADIHALIDRGEPPSGLVLP
jgi:hypothetical protein